MARVRASEANGDVASVKYNTVILLYERLYYELYENGDIVLIPIVTMECGSAHSMSMG